MILMPSCADACLIMSKSYLLIRLGLDGHVSNGSLLSMNSLDSAFELCYSIFILPVSMLDLALVPASLLIRTSS